MKVFCFLFFLCQSTWAVDYIYYNNKAVSRIDRDEYSKALQELVDVVSDRPFDPIPLFNTSSSLLGLSRIEDAEKTLRILVDIAIPDAEKNKLYPPATLAAVKFVTHFNYAYVLSKKGELNNALENYQSALDIYPRSLEVKTNIELLVQQMQGGGGKSDQENEDDQQDQEGEGQGQQQKQQEQEQQSDQQKQQKKQKNKKPKEFKSKELSKQDVKQILDELKRQEEDIRKRINEKQTKSKPIGKDW